ncbi:uncharacterized protein LOC117321068 [Pecten maximus]|uniref:uncharacterized protein LOC117321068 n=1 Tax=Pecten maximus TaxID=6579 RepID=UPI00145833F4|nr:uncharacterized protein LOC117321068 [Pecten maximus]
MFLHKPLTTKSKTEVTSPCETTDCLGRTDEKSYNEVTMASPRQVPTDLNNSHGHSLSLLYGIIIIGLVLLVLIGIGNLYLNVKTSRGFLNVYQHHRRRERDVEIANESESLSLRGIQEVGENRHPKGGTAPENETMIHDTEEPGTFYPPINENPAEPTAPDLSIPGLACPPIHVSSAWSTSNPSNKGC